MMWEYVSGLAFKLVGAWLDNKQASAEIKQKWFDFIKAVDQSSLDSAKVLSSYQEQLKKFKETPQ
jgi:hypothetical protein